MFHVLVMVSILCTFKNNPVSKDYLEDVHMQRSILGFRILEVQTFDHS